jgi:hypothetical protein
MAEAQRICTLSEQSDEHEVLLQALAYPDPIRDSELFGLLFETPKRAVLYHAYINRGEDAWATATDIAEMVNDYFHLGGKDKLTPQQVGKLVKHPEEILAELQQDYDRYRKRCDRAEDAFADAIVQMQGQQGEQGVAPSSGHPIPQWPARVALQVMEAAAHVRGDRQTEQHLAAANREIMGNPGWKNFLVEDAETIKEAFEVASGAARSVFGFVRNAWERRGGEATDRQAGQQVQRIAEAAQTVAYTLSQRAKEDWHVTKQAVSGLMQDVCDKARNDLAITRAVLGNGTPQESEAVIAQLTRAARGEGRG